MKLSTKTAFGQPYKEWVPQFPDGSGWDTDMQIPYYYEHISQEDLEGHYNKLESEVYKVVCVLNYEEPTHIHRNTYFVKGEQLQMFLEDYINGEFFEEVVSIEKVGSIPSFKKKLR